MTAPTVEDTQERSDVPVPELLEEEEEKTAPAGPSWWRLCRLLAQDLIPPQIWSEDRPCLAKQVAYARRGEWGPKVGPWRTATLAYFWVIAMPSATAGYAWAWIVERPTRLAAAGLLGWAIWLAWPWK